MKLPDFQALGTPITPQAVDSVASYKGEAAAPAEASQQFGMQMQKSGSDLQETQDKVNTLYATSHLLSSTIEAQKQAELEPDPVKAAAMYSAAKDQAVQQGASMITGGEARSAFIAGSGEHTRYMDMAFGQNLVNKRENNAIAGANQLLQTNLQNAIAAPDDASANALIDNSNMILHSLALTAPGKFTPQDEMAARNNFVNTYVKTKVQAYLDSGDVANANQLYASNKSLLPGQDQFELEKVLHAGNLQQYAANSVASLKSGVTPAPLGGMAVQAVKDSVVSAAKSAGIDPNASLTIASIESSFGQNLGSRGDIGQTGKPASDLQGQAKNLVDEQQKAITVADNALGRPAQPWEQYVAYQQGAGGGAALLRADPTDKAIDVLSPLYKTPAIAAKAITGNGGNVSMSVGQFLSFINRNYDAHAARVSIGLPDSDSEQVSPALQRDMDAADSYGPAKSDNAPPTQAPSIGTNAPSSTPLPTLQQGGNPQQSLLEYDKVYPSYLQYANSIDNPMQRKAVLDRLEQDHKIYEQSASAYRATIVNSAGQLMADPNFTSIDQVPRETMVALAEDHPETIRELNARADYNMKKQIGLAAKNDQTNSPNGYDTIIRSLDPNDGMHPNGIFSEDHLNRLLGKPVGEGGINMKDKIDASKSLEADDQWKKYLLNNMKAVVSANGNVDGGGQDRALEYYNQMSDAMAANNALPSDKRIPTKDFIATLQKNGIPASVMPARQQQISNLAASQNPGINAATQPETVAVNPKTGERVVWRAGKWQPM
jgi:hypothetical protein